MCVPREDAVSMCAGDSECECACVSVTVSVNVCVYLCVWWAPGFGLLSRARLTWDFLGHTEGRNATPQLPKTGLSGAP